MKSSYKWLCQYFDALPEPEKLSVILTDCGLEVESIEHFQTIEGGLEGVVIGRVESCEKHPNADKLSLTKVDIGSGELLSVVCGAPNVAAGQKVLLATVGTKMNTPKGEFVIQKAKIRGELSEGMICAEDELGLGASHAGIMVLPEDAVVGIPAKEYFKVEDDYVFEIGLTPNRSDATSHLGVARDIMAVINCENFINGVPGISMKIPSVEAFHTDNTSRIIPVIVEDEAACPRYSGLTISGIKVSSSPDWLQNKLKAIGLRPINNIVDITNYVLFETGQPLHAFDADRISGNTVVVKKMPAGSEFKTLDHVVRKLDGNDLMICNKEAGMCMAGVFGGENSGVNESTTSIFLESACFDPATIRKTSRLHNLKTDAAFRFERGTDINLTIYALKRAALMIKEIAGGLISSEIVDVCPGDTTRKKVELSLEGLDRLTGKHIAPEIAQNILQSLDISITSQKDGVLSLEIPTCKVDVTREADVVEEILRIYGYGNIDLPESLRTNLSYSLKPDPERIRTALSDLFSGRGYHEILTNSLTTSAYSETFSKDFPPEKNVYILNPLSKELNTMRQSLLFTGMEVMAYNQNRKAGDLKLYEFGKVYSYSKELPSGLQRYHESTCFAIYLMGNYQTGHWREKVRPASFYDLKADVELFLRRVGIDPKTLEQKTGASETLSQSLLLYSGAELVCTLGQVSDSVRKYFDLKEDVFYACFEWEKILELLAQVKIQAQDIPKFPEVRRDLALLIGPEVTWSQLEELAYTTAEKILKEVKLFDIYTDEKLKGKRSYALSFFLQDEEKTLTDAEIDGTMKKLISAFETKLGAVLR